MVVQSGLHIIRSKLCLNRAFRHRFWLKLQRKFGQRSVAVREVGFQFRQFAREDDAQCRNLRGDDGREVFDVLRLREGEGHLPMSLRQLFDDLQCTHARQDGMSREVSAKDGMVGLQRQFVVRAGGRVVRFAGEVKEGIEESHERKMGRYCALEGRGENS